MITICCVCRRTKSQQGWIEQFHSEHVELSHGYCPRCYLQTIKKLADHNLHAPACLDNRAANLALDNRCRGLEN